MMNKKRSLWSPLKPPTKIETSETKSSKLNQKVETRDEQSYCQSC